MYRTYINFHKRVQGGDVPIVYVFITTDMGTRAYAEKELGSVFEASIEIETFDGSWIFDGTYTFGSEYFGILSKEGRLLSISGFERTIQPRTKDVLNSLTSKQAQYINISLDNTDRGLSKLINKEPFLTKEISVYMGFDDDPFEEHLPLFKGIIMENIVTQKDFQIRAEER